LEAIVVEDESWMFFETTMRVDALSKIKNLKLLMLPTYKKKRFSGNFNDLSNE